MFLVSAAIVRSTAGAGAFLFALTLSVTAYGADIKVLSSQNVRPVLSAISAEFERMTGHKLVAEYGPSIPVKNRIQAGEAADVAINLRPVLDDLLKQNRIVPGSLVDIADSTLGLFVRAGAPKPDISMTDALKRALLAAKSIAYSAPSRGTAGSIYVPVVLERLGIAERIKSKSVLTPGDAELVVARGEAEIGVSPILDFFSSPPPGIDLVGPLPDGLHKISISAGVVAGTHESVAAVELIKFLSSPAAVRAIKARGMEPH